MSIAPPVSPHREQDTRRWEAMILLMCLAFLNYLDRNLVFPLFNLISTDLGVDKTQLGLLTSGFYLVYALTAPLLGYVSDRIPRKSVLLIALVGWSLVTALSGTATSFLWLLIWRSLTGLGEGGYFPTALSVIGDLFDKHERGKMIAFHGVVATLGGSSGYAVGGFLGDHLGWRGCFFLAIIPGLLLAAVVSLRFREPTRGAFGAVDREHQGSSPNPPSPSRGWRGYLATITSAPVLLISLATFCASYSFNGLNSWLPNYLQDERAFSMTQAGVLSGIAYGATLLGQLSGGTLSDWLAPRVGGSRPLLVALAYFLVTPAILAVPTIPWAMAAVVAYGLTQVGRGFAEPNMYGTVIDAVPATERGAAQGFLLMLSFGGASISPTTTGYIIDRVGYRSAFASLAGFAGMGGLLAALLSAIVRRQLRKDNVACL